MQFDLTIVPSDGNDSLVLERIPNGELVWLRPAEDEPRYTITDAGRVAIVEYEREAAARSAAVALLFGTTPGATLSSSGNQRLSVADWVYVDVPVVALEDLRP